VRALTTVATVLALCLACGGSSPPSGNVGPGQATLHITTSGNGVVRGAGSDCRGTCTLTPAAGTQIQLQAVPDAGATFAGWSGACSGTGTCQVTVNGDVSVTATFTRREGIRNLTVVVEGQGRVVSNPAGIDCPAAACSALFSGGTTVSLAATSAAGSKFTGWGGGACSGPGACSVTLNADTQVFAHFDVLPPAQATLSVAASGPGQVTGAGLSCGNGATACSAKMAPGTLVTLTASAAPQARFMGWGGGCSGTSSSCQLVVQNDISVTASFEFELQTLAVNDGTNGFALALNSTSVFFARSTRDGNGIWSVPKSGGTAMLVTSGNVAYLVADDAFVYWTDSIGIYSAPVGGGSGSLLATGLVGRLALDDEGALYWINMRDFQGGRGALHRVQNRVDAVIASGQNQNLGVAVDATHAYFTCSSADRTDQAIRRVPRKGGSVETVVTTTVAPLTVRVDSQNVYFRDANSAVWARSKSGGPARELSAPNGSSGFVGGGEFDVNAFVAWWMWGSGGTGPKGLFRANADGSGFTGVDTGADFNWFGLRVDDTAVYYLHAGALLKRLK
jgi:Divergent InlB B-repeat domain